MSNWLNTFIKGACHVRGLVTSGEAVEGSQESFTMASFMSISFLMISTAFSCAIERGKLKVINAFAGIPFHVLLDVDCVHHNDGWWLHP